MICKFIAACVTGRPTFLNTITEVKPSTTQFEVLGLGLEGQVPGLESCKFSKMPCPWLENSTIF